MANRVKYLSTDEVLAKQVADPALFILDVRTEEEWKSHHIPGAVLIPMHTLLVRLYELDPKRETIVVCEHGVRSENVALYLTVEANFEDVATMDGGMSEWSGPRAHGP